MFSTVLDLIHVGAHLGPCPLTGVHRAARRGLRPLRYQRRHLQKTFGFSELGGILSDLAHPALDSFYDRGQLIELFLD